MTLREVFVRLGLDFDSAGFAAADAVVEVLKKGLGLAVDAVKALGRAFVDAISHTVHTASELDDLSKRTGISTDSLQKLGYAAAQSGVGTDELAIGLQNLSRQAYAASKGSEESQRAFGRLGIHIRDNNGQLKTAETLMGEAADAFHRMPTGVEKSTLAMQLFGKSGTRLLPVFAEGSAGIRRWTDEAEALGLVMSEETVKAGDDLGDKFLTLTKIGDAWRALFAGPIIETLNEVVDEFLAWVKANKELIKQKLVQWGQLVASTLKTLVTVGKSLAAAVLELTGYWKAMAVVLGAVVLAAIWSNIAAIVSTISWYGALSIASIVSGAKMAKAWLGATWPVMLLVAGMALLILAVDEVLTALDGGDTVMAKWTKFYDEILRDQKDDIWILRQLKAAARFLADLQEGMRGLFTIAQPTYDPNFKQEKPGEFKTWLRNFLGSPQSDISPEMANEMFGGGASPVASVRTAAGAAEAAGPKISAPSFSATINANQAPGESSNDFAASLVEHIDSWWEAKMRASGAAGGG